MDKLSPELFNDIACFASFKSLSVFSSILAPKDPRSQNIKLQMKCRKHASFRFEMGPPGTVAVLRHSYVKFNSFAKKPIRHPWEFAMSQQTSMQSFEFSGSAQELNGLRYTTDEMLLKVSTMPVDASGPNSKLHIKDMKTDEAIKVFRELSKTLSSDYQDVSLEGIADSEALHKLLCRLAGSGRTRNLSIMFCNIKYETKRILVEFAKQKQIESFIFRSGKNPFEIADIKAILDLYALIPVKKRKSLLITHRTSVKDHWQLRLLRNQLDSTVNRVIFNYALAIDRSEILFEPKPSKRVNEEDVVMECQAKNKRLNALVT